MPRKFYSTTVLFSNNPKYTTPRRTPRSFGTDSDLLFENDESAPIEDMREFFDLLANINEYVLVKAEIAMPDGNLHEGGGVFTSWRSALNCITSEKDLVTITEDKYGNFYMTTVNSEGLESFYRFKTLTPDGITYYLRRPYETRKSIVDGLWSCCMRVCCCHVSEKLHSASQNGTRVAQAA